MLAEVVQFGVRTTGRLERPECTRFGGNLFFHRAQVELKKIDGEKYLLRQATKLTDQTSERITEQFPDSAFPTHCECGYEFTEGDTRGYEVMAFHENGDLFISVWGEYNKYGVGYTPDGGLIGEEPRRVQVKGRPLSCVNV